MKDVSKSSSFSSSKSGEEFDISLFCGALKKILINFFNSSNKRNLLFDPHMPHNSYIKKYWVKILYAKMNKKKSPKITGIVGPIDM